MSSSVTHVLLFACTAVQYAASSNTRAQRLHQALDERVPYRNGIVLDVQLWLCDHHGLDDESRWAEFGDLPHIQHLRAQGWEAIGPLSIATQGDARTSDLQAQCSFLDEIYEIDLVSVWLGSTCYSLPETNAILLGMLAGALRIARREVQGIIVVHNESLAPPRLSAVGFEATEVFEWFADSNQLPLGMSAALYAPRCTPLQCEVGSIRATLLQLVGTLDSSAWHPEVEGDSSPSDLTNDMTSWLHEVAPGESVSTGGLAMVLGVTNMVVKELGNSLLSQEACECYVGRLSMRFFWLAGMLPAQLQESLHLMTRRSMIAPYDIIRTFVDSIASPGWQILAQPLREETEHMHGTGMAWWLTQQQSLSFATVLRASSWPLFRMMELLRLRTMVAISQGFVSQDDVIRKMKRCQHPFVEPLLTNLLLAVERDTPVPVELLNAILVDQAGMVGIDCSLALASLHLARALVLQCPSSRHFKASRMSAVAVQTAQEILESLLDKVGTNGTSWLLQVRWPIWNLLARIERWQHRLAQSGLRRHLPRHNIFTAGTIQDHMFLEQQAARPSQALVVGFSESEKALLGGNWAEVFVKHAFSQDDRFVIDTRSYCPDVVVFSASVPDNTNGIAIFVDGESGVDGSNLPSLSASLYIGPGTPEEAAAILWIPFASMSFAYRSQSPAELLTPSSLRYTIGRSLGVAYVASNCVHHREAAFRALAARLPESRALGACTGSLKNTDAPVRHTTAQRSAKGYLEDAVHHFEDFDFALVFESAKAPRYVTEKIVNAYLAGAIPIYWGSDDVRTIFNPDTFISAADFASFEDMAAHVAAMSADERHAMRNAPPLAEGAAERFFSWHQDIAGTLDREITDIAANLHSRFAEPSF